MQTTAQRLTIRHTALVWSAMMGVLILQTVVLTLLSRIPHFRDYYLFEWLIFPSNVVGFLIAVGLLTACLLLPAGLVWWRMAINGAGAGAAASVIAGIFYSLAYGMNFTSLTILFLALAGAFPGMVIVAVYSSFLAGRGRSVVHYVGAGLVAGTVVTILASAALLMQGILLWSLDAFRVIGNQLWLVPTLFSAAVMISLFVGDFLRDVLRAKVPGEPS